MRAECCHSRLCRHGRSDITFQRFHAKLRVLCLVLLAMLPVLSLPCPHRPPLSASPPPLQERPSAQPPRLPRLPPPPVSGPPHQRLRAAHPPTARALRPPPHPQPLPPPPPRSSSGPREPPAWSGKPPSNPRMRQRRCFPPGTCTRRTQVLPSVRPRRRGSHGRRQRARRWWEAERTRPP